MEREAATTIEGGGRAKEFDFYKKQALAEPHRKIDSLSTQ